jgi:hypothetical protein
MYTIGPTVFKVERPCLWCIVVVRNVVEMLWRIRLFSFVFWMERL